MQATLRQQFPAVQQVKLLGEAALELLHLFHRAPPALRPLLCRVGVQQAQHQHAAGHGAADAAAAHPAAETAAKAKDGVKKGAYVLVDTEGTPDVILMASGSEVQWAVAAAKTLAGEGVKARVVSVPSMEWFEEQDAEYKESVLPASVKARVSVEAGVAMPWYKYLGSYGKPVSIEQFGLQGDGAQNMIDLGITAEHVVEAAKASIAEVEAAK